MNSKFTLNYGVRLEHEDGLREENDGFTVAFDRTLNPGGALGRRQRERPAGSRRSRVCGRQRRQRVPGQSTRAESSRRASAWSTRSTRRRSCAPATASTGRRGTTRASARPTTATSASRSRRSSARASSRPTASLTNPFPQRRHPAARQQPRRAGRCRRRRSSSSTRTSRRRRCTSTRWTSRASSRGNMAIGFEYVGATGRDLDLGGSNDGIININQVPIQHLSLGQALLDQVPNPFFGLPAGQGKSVTSPTIQRRELLRPFPQFNDILMRQATLGESQYHAAVFKLDKRMSNGWGGRINYTYSRLKDNQFGETNFFSNTAAEAAGCEQPRRRVLHRSPRRAAQDHHLADRRAAVRRGQEVAAERRRRRDPRRLDDLVDHLDRERLPDLGLRQHPATRNSSPACSASTRARAKRKPTARATSASRRRPVRAARSSECGTGFWLNSAGVRAARGVHARHAAAHSR